MISSINKFKGLSEQVDIVNTVYDLAIDFRGPRTIARNTNESNTDRLELWLNSEQGDSVGDPIGGGVVKNLIGKILNAENLKYYEDLIRDRLKKEFEGELDVLSVELLPHKILRTVTVNVIAIDKLTGNITSTTATTR